MLRRLSLLLLAALPAVAAIWPEQLYDHKRTRLDPITITDKPVWEEYGLEAAERATEADRSEEHTSELQSRP